MLRTCATDVIVKATQYARQAWGELLTGKQVLTAWTRPCGCIVKFKSS
jgi:hypothetical protein